MRCRVTDKTLGQVAFLRFHYELGDKSGVDAMRAWVTEPQSYRDAWEAAARAVAAEVERRKANPCPECAGLGSVNQGLLGSPDWVACPVCQKCQESDATQTQEPDDEIRVGVDKVLASVRFWLALNEAERAVVDAARQWAVRPGIQRRIDNLTSALEAYEKAELGAEHGPAIR